MKKCCVCKTEKSYSDFNKDKSRKDGYSNKCRSCMKTLQKRHYKQNKEEVKQKVSQYRKDNPEKRRETKIKSYWNCIDNERERRKKYYYDNIETQRKQAREYQQKFNDKCCLKKAKRRRILLGYDGDILKIDLKIYQLNRKIKQVKNGISKQKRVNNKSNIQTSLRSNG